MTSASLTPVAAPELLSTLRAATGDLHRRVEARLEPGGPWTLAQYAVMLQAFHCIITPIESRLSDLLGEVFAAPPPLNRAERLCADLHALGYDCLSAPVIRTLYVDGRADAFGIGYVLQGSLLGGAVIVKALRRDLGGPVVPTQYLEMYGDRLSGAWKRFCDATNAFGRETADDEHERTTEAAIATFHAVERALDRIR